MGSLLVQMLFVQMLDRGCTLLALNGLLYKEAAASAMRLARRAVT